MTGIKLMGAGILLSTIVEVVAQAMPDVSLGTLLNASATAILGTLCFWQATKTIPAIVKSHSEATTEAASKHSEAMQAVANEHTTVVKDLLTEAAKDRERMHADNAAISGAMLALCKQCTEHTALLRTKWTEIDRCSK